MKGAMQWVLVGLAAVGLLAIWKACGDDRTDDGPVIPPAVDSAYNQDVRQRPKLDTMQQTWVRTADSLRQENAAHEQNIARLRRMERAAKATAAEAAARARAAGDTLSLAWDAYEMEKARGDTLAAALDESEALRSASDSAAILFRLAYDSADARTRRLQRISDDLREAVDVAARRNECRFLGMKCPTRRQTFIAGAVIGVVGGAYLGGVGR